VCDPDGMLSKYSGDAVEGVLKRIASGEPPYAQAGTCGGRRSNAGYQVRACKQSIGLHHGEPKTNSVDSESSPDTLGQPELRIEACNDTASTNA